MELILAIPHVVCTASSLNTDAIVSEQVRNLRSSRW